MLVNRTLVVLLMLLCVPMWANAQDLRPDTPATLTVTGEGEVSVEPDRVVVMLGAEAQNKEATAAQSQVNGIVTKVLAAVKGAGVAEKHVRTSSIELYPVYSQPQYGPRPGMVGEDEGPQEPKLTGYRASNTIRVEIDDMSKIGDVIDAAMKAGANRMDGVQFDVQHRGPVEREAMKDAARQAQTKAAALAEAMGVKLLSVQSVQEGGAVFPVDAGPRRMMTMQADYNSTPVAPGEITVRASVTVTYRLGATEVKAE